MRAARANVPSLLRMVVTLHMVVTGKFVQELCLARRHAPALRRFALEKRHFQDLTKDESEAKP